MHELLWIGIAWSGGILAILGSLMTLGSLLLWLVPSQPPKTRKPEQPASSTSPAWQKRLQLTAFSVAIATIGWSLLVFFPFPHQ